MVRVACPWLIRRFIDPNAVFLFVPSAEVAGVAEHAKAATFDVEGAFWGDRGERTTFDVMLEEFGLDTEPLAHLALIVRGADTGRLDLTPQSAGLSRPVSDIPACTATTSSNSRPRWRTLTPSTAAARRDR